MWLISSPCCQWVPYVPVARVGSYGRLNNQRKAHIEAILPDKWCNAKAIHFQPLTATERGAFGSGSSWHYQISRHFCINKIYSNWTLCGVRKTSVSEMKTLFLSPNRRKKKFKTLFCEFQVFNIYNVEKHFFNKTKWKGVVCGAARLEVMCRLWESIIFHPKTYSRCQHLCQKESLFLSRSLWVFGGGVSVVWYFVLFETLQCFTLPWWSCESLWCRIYINSDNTNKADVGGLEEEGSLQSLSDTGL